MPERRIVSGDSDNPDLANPLPVDNTVTRGLVASGDRLIVDGSTRGQVWRAGLLGLMGQKRKSDQILLGIFNRQR